MRRRVNRLARALSVAATVLAVWSAGASAGTVSLRADGLGGDHAVRYDGASGEGNVVTTRRIDYSTVRLVDSGATIEAEDECRAIDAHTAECVAPQEGGIELVEVFTGDGADRVVGSVGRVTARGGRGPDVLMLKGQGSGTLVGGPGRDRLLGGRHGDVLVDGDDSLVADVFHGGGGDDRVSYASRKQPVVVDLGKGRGGAIGERDRYKGIEEVLAGAGDDVLRNAGRSRVLVGGPGDDFLTARGRAGGRLEGGPGADVLVSSAKVGLEMNGGVGADEIRGGAGPDLVNGYRGSDTLACGGGPDVVLGPETQDELRTDCERADLSTFPVKLTVSLWPRRRDGAFVFDLECVSDPEEGSTALEGTLTLRAPDGGAVLAREKLMPPVDHCPTSDPARHEVVAHLTKRGRKRLARSKLRLEVHWSVDVYGERVDAAWRLRLGS